MILVKPNDMIFWTYLILEAKNIRFYSNFSAGNMGKKRGVAVADRQKLLSVL